MDPIERKLLEEDRTMEYKNKNNIWLIKLNKHNFKFTHNGYRNKRNEYYKEYNHDK